MSRFFCLKQLKIKIFLTEDPLFVGHLYVYFQVKYFIVLAYLLLYTFFLVEAPLLMANLCVYVIIRIRAESTGPCRQTGIILCQAPSQPVNHTKSGQRCLEKIRELRKKNR